jgi:malate synthase
MNDLATYRIFVSWLWTLANNKAKITKAGFIKGPKLTKDGIIPDNNVYEVKAGTVLDKELFHKIWEQHYKWTEEFYRDYDRLVALRLIIGTIALKGGKLEGSISQIVDEALKGLVLVKNISDESVVQSIAKTVGVEYKPEMLDVSKKINKVQDIVSLAYGKAPSYKRFIRVNDAARKISRMLGISYSYLSNVLVSNEPMFDRSNAPIIMSILERQIMSPNYIQHSARVLFSVADKDGQIREKLLDIIYYLDKNLNPKFRDTDGKPSRSEIEKAVKKRKVPRDALQIHDYIYDYFC